MRYTLRLLTLQQFQRATALLCAMEVLRSNDVDIWGPEPFTLGLWVGNRVTPGLRQVQKKQSKNYAVTMEIDQVSPLQHN